MLVEKYRPDTLDGIMGQKKIIASLKGYIEAREMPNLLFVGKPGIGKTATAIALAKDMGCYPGGFLELNASDERGIKIVRENIKNFARTKAITTTGWKIILLDEADELTKPAQQALRRTMEVHHRTVRFILTVNSLGKLKAALRSRCTPYQFRGLHPSHVKTLLIKVALKEGVKISAEVNQAIIKTVHGDMRMALNILEAMMSLDEPTADDVYELMGVVDDKNVFSMMHGALKGDMKALKTMKKLLDGGANAHQLMNTMYWMAIRGGIGMTEKKSLDILSVMGTIPGTSDEMVLTSILARLILKQGKIKEVEE